MSSTTIRLSKCENNLATRLYDRSDTLEADGLYWMTVLSAVNERRKDCHDGKIEFGREENHSIRR